MDLANRFIVPIMEHRIDDVNNALIGAVVYFLQLSTF